MHPCFENIAPYGKIEQGETNSPCRSCHGEFYIHAAEKGLYLISQVHIQGMIHSRESAVYPSVMQFTQ